MDKQAHVQENVKYATSTVAAMICKELLLCRIVPKLFYQGNISRQAPKGLLERCYSVVDVQEWMLGHGAVEPCYEREISEKMKAENLLNHFCIIFDM